MKKSIVIKEGKNIWDVVVEYYGSVDGIKVFLEDNPGLTVNSSFTPGQTVYIDPNKATNRQMAQFLQSRAYRINTGDIRQPAAPTDLIATTGEGLGEIDLSWTDAGSDTVKFELFRSLNETGPFVKVADIPAPTTTYTDTGLQDNRMYYYRIRAINTVTSSNYSGIASASTRAEDLLFVSATSGDIAPTVTKSGATAIWKDATQTYTSNAPTIQVSGAETIRLFVDDQDTVTTLNLDNCQVTGTIDFDRTDAGKFVNLLTFSAINNNFLLLPGQWVRKANVAINLTNSVITLGRLAQLFDALILANGGTTTDNSTDYTGSAGQTHASRTLQVGSLVLDLNITTDRISYQKYLALEAVGWTITTIKTFCDMNRRIDTGDSFFVATELPPLSVGSGSFFGIMSDPGKSMNAKLYTTIFQAFAGGATGLLAVGQSGINSYLASLSSSAGSYGLRVFAADSFGNENPMGVTSGQILYKGIPNEAFLCGEQEDILNLTAFAVYSLKLLRGDYSGPLVAVKCGAVTENFYANNLRALRWTDSDPAPSSGYTSSLQAFKTANGGGNLELVTLYDQSNNGLDLANQNLVVLNQASKMIEVTANGRLFRVLSVPERFNFQKITFCSKHRQTTLAGANGTGLLALDNNDQILQGVSNSTIEGWFSSISYFKSPGPAATLIYNYPVSVGGEVLKFITAFDTDLDETKTWVNNNSGVVVPYLLPSGRVITQISIGITGVPRALFQIETLLIYNSFITDTQANSILGIL